MVLPCEDLFLEVPVHRWVLKNINSLIVVYHYIAEGVWKNNGLIKNMTG